MEAPQHRPLISIAAVIMNLANPNATRPAFDDVGPEWEELLRWIDTDDPDFDGSVWFEASQTIVLSDDGAQRLGQSLLQAMARGRQFADIHICTYYMTADADQYSALLEFLASGQYGYIFFHQEAAWPAPEPGRMRAAMEHIVTAMLANQQPVPAGLEFFGVTLTMPILHLALQYPSIEFFGCRMETLLLTDHDNHLVVAAALRNRPEQGIHLRLGNINDNLGILQAATTINTNVTSLKLSFHNAIVGRLDLSRLFSFVATQPNGMDLTFVIFEPSTAIVEHILADVSNKCPGVHSLLIQFDGAVSPLIRERFPRLKELMSDSSLTRLAFESFSGDTVLSPEQEQEMAVIIKRNIAILVYLQSTNLPKPRQPPVVDPNDPPALVVYANHGEDRRKHLFLLSHALSQAAAHPIFFSHVYEYIREHVDELFGGGPVDQQQLQDQDNNNGSTRIEI
jgi:hypothetical protein